MTALDDQLIAYMRAAPGRRYLDGFTCAALRKDLARDGVFNGARITGQQVGSALKRLRAARVVDCEPRERYWDAPTWFLCEQVTLDSAPQD